MTKTVRPFISLSRACWISCSDSVSTREVASTLLRTYLGADAGAKVLLGQIKRGDGQIIRAALWFCDVRNFTGLSDQLPFESLLLLLNDFHGQMSDAVEAHDGQVLKFMGDGMLAVFEADEDDDGCTRALAAADDAAQRMARVNERRLPAGEPEIRYGLALHWGDVMYGNIGSSRRLDFTVIGPAVNMAARLEGLCSKLGTDLIISAPFARRCGQSLRSLGLHQLKGIKDPVEAFDRP